MHANVLRRSLLSTAILLSFTTIPAFATNGLAPIGLGMEHRSLGGAATGYAANTSSIASNPASTSFVADGFDAGLEIFQPKRTAIFNGKAFGMPADVSYDGNGKQNFFIPEGSYKRSFKQFDFGVAVYGNGGMNTSYAKNPNFGTGKAGVDYQQLFVAPTLSYKLNENHSIGASANLVYHKFKAEGLHNFDNARFSANPGHVTNNGYDSSTGIGVSLGWYGKIAPNVSMGVAYRSKVNMGKLDQYSGLFANSGEFDVPAALSAGFAWQAAPNTLIVGDVQKIDYSLLAAIGNSSHKPVQFGGKDGPGFGWKDVTAIKLGVKQQVTPQMALMVGYNQGTNPVKSSDTTVNVLAPGVAEQHLTLGAEWQLTPKSSLIASFVHTFEGETNGDNTVPPPGPIPLDAYDLKMKQNAIGVSYSHQF
ncbi:MAG: OmpP1/FadL family transporter [Thiolinea sp.]